MAPKSNIKLAFFLNFAFTILEIVGGLLTNSVALISDAIHDLGDSLSLGMSWYLEHLSKKKPTTRFTYGYGRFSVLGGLFTSVVLLGGIVFIILEAIPRILTPEPVNAPVVLLFAIVGVVVNGFAAWKTSHGSSINERVISLHLLEDVLGWVVLLIVAGVMSIWPLPILDPILSIVYSIFILFHVAKNLREIGVVFLEGFDRHVDLDALKTSLMVSPLVLDVHHIHYWTLDGMNNYMTLHVVLADSTTPQDHVEILHHMRHILEDSHFHHITIETEYVDCEHRNCEPLIAENPPQHVHHHHHH